MAAVMPTGRSVLTTLLAEQLGTTTGWDELHGRTESIGQIEADFGLLPYREGDIFLADNLRTGTGELAVLVDLFLFGDARGTHLAAMEIERRAKAC